MYVLQFMADIICGSFTCPLSRLCFSCGSINMRLFDSWSNIEPGRTSQQGEALKPDINDKANTPRLPSGPTKDPQHLPLLRLLPDFCFIWSSELRIVDLMSRAGDVVKTGTAKREYRSPIIAALVFKWLMFGEQTNKYWLCAWVSLWQAEPTRIYMRANMKKQIWPQLPPPDPPTVSAVVWPRSDCRRHHGSSGAAQNLHDQRRLGLRRPHRPDRSGRGHLLHRLLWLLRRLERELLHGYHGNGATTPAI